MAAKILYPEALAVLPKSLNPNVKVFLSIRKDVFDALTPHEIELEKVMRLIVVDTNKWGRLDQMDRLKKKKSLEIFLWDHHLSEVDIEATWKCEGAVGANITLLIRGIKQQNIELTPIQATLFWAGLYEDTGTLTFPATKAEDALAAAYLLQQGADPSVLSSFLRPAYGENQRKVLTRMLQSAKKTWTRRWKNHACFGRGWPSGRWFCLDQINQPRSARIDSRCKMAIRSKLQKSNCRSHRRISGSR